MSRNDEEEGTIKLPSAAFAAVRQAVQKAMEAERAEVLQQITEAYELAPASALKDEYALLQWAHTQGKRPFDPFGDPKWPLLDSDLAHSALYRMRGTGGKLKKPRAAFLGPAPTNRTTEFYSDSGRLHFDTAQKTVEWSVDRNNHAVKSARATRIFAAFDAAIRQVRWTRGTGGTIRGTDEHHEDGYAFGGERGYTTGAYGPIGAEEEPYRYEPFIDSAGVRHDGPNSSYAQKGLKRQAAAARATARALTDAAQQARVSRGVPTGGQFASGRRPEGSIWLR